MKNAELTVPLTNWELVKESGRCDELLASLEDQIWAIAETMQTDSQSDTRDTRESLHRVRGEYITDAIRDAIEIVAEEIRENQR